MDNEIILAHNLGLGDHLICNGLVNYLSKNHIIFLPTYSHNISSVKSLYSDNPKVHLIPINKQLSIWSDPDIFNKELECFGIPIIDVELFKYKPISTIWYRYFYSQFDIPFSYRIEYFKLPSKLNNISIDSKNYRIVHSSSSATQHYELDLPLSDLDTIFVTNDKSENLLEWISVFQNAKEIHVVDSSVFWLIDILARLDKINSELWFHDIRLTNDPIYDDLLTIWNVKRYDFKI